MLIIEWLLMLPNGSGVTVAKKTVTNFDTTEEAVSRAREIWPVVRIAGNRTSDGFRVVDQDGRIMAAARLGAIDDLAA